MELLHPRNFKEIIHEKLKNNRFEGIFTLILTIDISKLKSELSQFAREWPSLKNPTLFSDIQDNNNYLDDGNEDENYSDQGPGHQRKAKGCGTDCLISCLKVLVDCNLFSAEYVTLYVVYKTVLTIPMTQVCCKRSFSRLKIIKTRLRNTLCQENLETYIMIKMNRRWTDEVENISIIQSMCENSSEFAKLLQL